MLFIFVLLGAPISEPVATNTVEPLYLAVLGARVSEPLATNTSKPPSSPTTKEILRRPSWFLVPNFVWLCLECFLLAGALDPREPNNNGVDSLATRCRR